MRIFRVTFYVLSAVCCLLTAPEVWAARCGISDLTKCLDSACAPTSEAGARCWTCGTSAAKKPDAPAMQGLSLGRSSKTTLSASELKNAPSEPGERYQWATKECLQKMTDCAAGDVTDNYDKLIEQSCKAVLGDTGYASSIKKAAVAKTSDQCGVDITGCLLTDAKCGGTMLGCEDDSEFNRNFSACVTQVSGCDDFVSDLRASMLATRDNMVSQKEGRISDLVKVHQDSRKQKFDTANKMCVNDGKKGCIIEMCGNMANGLNENGECSDSNELMWATNLCKFVDIACDKLK